jgi:CubicO group peptidase (beta-lactamase class C family)
MAAPVGARFEYTQTNYVLLGRIISNLSDISLLQVVRTGQVDPVSMPRTGFPDQPGLLSNTAGRYSFYRVTPDGPARTSTLQSRSADEQFPLWFAACNGLLSTAEDLSHWLIALQNGALLKRSTVQSTAPWGRSVESAPRSWSTPTMIWPLLCLPI